VCGKAGRAGAGFVFVASLKTKNIKKKLKKLHQRGVCGKAGRAGAGSRAICMCMCGSMCTFVPVKQVKQAALVQRLLAASS
jgi:hypothetical protein